jgi:hypothetical protein
MNVSKMLLSGVIALALVPAAAQAANAAPARAASVSPAAQSLALSTPVRAGAVTGKKSHLLGLGVFGTLLIAAGAVAAAVVVADAVDNGSSG